MRAAWVVASLLVVGCTVQGEDLFPPVDAGPVVESDLPQEVADIFTANCAGSGCHTNGGEAGGLMLDPDVALDELVGIESALYMIVRVIPGDPENSLLIKKLQGDPTVGLRMPVGPPLTDGQIQTISGWIEGLEDSMAGQ